MRVLGPWLTRRLPLLLALAASGCADLAYYGQAIRGHLDLMSRRRPVAEVLADPGSAPELRARLEAAQGMRAFATSVLALPDNDSYRSYAALGRPYAVWNVFAVPELSLEPVQWCVPVAGCVAYRGYFDRDAAEAEAARLRARGMDVFIGGVPAYSTLGWFDDPLLDTFVHWPPGRVAELLFHELAHQRLFVAGDTPFNESFATAVGRLGARLWLARRGTGAQRREYERFVRRQRQMLELAYGAREAMAELYASPASEARKRAGKARILARLVADYRAPSEGWRDGPRFDWWLERDLNNAKLAALSAYHRLVPAFERLHRDAGGDFQAFYRAVADLGRRPAAEREAELERLAEDAGSVVPAAAPQLREARPAGPAGEQVGHDGLDRPGGQAQRP